MRSDDLLTAENSIVSNPYQNYRSSIRSGAVPQAEVDSNLVAAEAPFSTSPACINSSFAPKGCLFAPAGCLTDN